MSARYQLHAKRRPSSDRRTSFDRRPSSDQVTKNCPGHPTRPWDDTALTNALMALATDLANAKARQEATLAKELPVLADMLECGSARDILIHEAQCLCLSEDAERIKMVLENSKLLAAEFPQPGESPAEYSDRCLATVRKQIRIAEEGAAHAVQQLLEKREEIERLTRVGKADDQTMKKLEKLTVKSAKCDEALQAALEAADAAVSRLKVTQQAFADFRPMLHAGVRNRAACKLGLAEARRLKSAASALLDDCKQPQIVGKRIEIFEESLGRAEAHARAIETERNVQLEIQAKCEVDLSEASVAVLHAALVDARRALTGISRSLSSNSTQEVCVGETCSPGDVSENLFAVIDTSEVRRWLFSKWGPAVALPTQFSVEAGVDATVALMKRFDKMASEFLQLQERWDASFKTLRHDLEHLKKFALYLSAQSEEFLEVLDAVVEGPLGAAALQGWAAAWIGQRGDNAALAKDISDLGHSLGLEVNEGSVDETSTWREGLLGLRAALLLLNTSDLRSEIIGRTNAS